MKCKIGLTIFDFGKQCIKRLLALPSSHPPEFFARITLNNGHFYIKIYMAGDGTILEEYSNYIIENEALFDIERLYNCQLN